MRDILAGFQVSAAVPSQCRLMHLLLQQLCNRKQTGNLMCETLLEHAFVLLCVVAKQGCSMQLGLQQTSDQCCDQCNAVSDVRLKCLL